MSGAEWSGSVIYRLSYSGAPRDCQPVNAETACPSFRAPDQSARHRTGRRGTDRAGRRRRSDHRSAVPHARVLPRPQRPADDPRRPTRHRRHAGGGGGAPRAARDIPPALADHRQGRHRHRRTGVLQVHPRAQTPPGAKLLVSGKLDVFNGRLTIAHPEHLVPIDQPDRIPAIEPVWPLTAGLWPRQVAAGAGPGAGAAAGPAGMARPGAAEAREMAAVRRGPARRASARPRPNPTGACARAWPMTSCSPARSPWR